MKTKSLFLITILTCSACSSSTSESTASDSFDPRILEEVVAEKTAHQQVLTFNGLVAVNEDKLYQYKAPEEGIVEQIYFAMGDFIQKGERLLTFKSPHYNALQNELLANRKNVAIQQRGLASAKSLYEDQLLSHEEYLTAESNLELAQQELAQVQNTLAIYGTPIADNLFEIRAKQSGYVIQKDITPFLTIGKEDHLLSIADLSTLWIQVQIHPTQIPLIRKGNRVDIHSATYPQEVFKGEIFQLSPIIDPKEKVMHALIVVNNESFKLKPSMVVEVQVKLDNPTTQVVVPTEALIFDENEQHIVTRRGEEYQVNLVKAANRYKDSTFILEGIKEGDTVITKNNLLIYNHLKNKSH